MSLSVPSELESIEPGLRDLILASVSRGRVSGRVVLQYTGSSRASSVAVNETQAKAYRRELSKLAKSLEIPDNLSMEGLLRLPGVLENAQPTLDAKAFRAPIKSALGQALEGLLSMREKEGGNLGRDLAKRLAKLRRIVKRVAKLAPDVLKHHRERLIERLKKNQRRGAEHGRRSPAS